MATTKRIENMSLEEVEKALQETEARTRILAQMREKKKQEEYAALCRLIAEFVLDLSDLDAPPVRDFQKRMEEKKYEPAAKILIHELSTAAENAPTRAARKDQETTRRKRKQSTGMKAEAGA